MSSAVSRPLKNAKSSRPVSATARTICCAVPTSPTPSLKPTTFGFCARRRTDVDRSTARCRGGRSRRADRMPRPRPRRSATSPACGPPTRYGGSTSSASAPASAAARATSIAWPSGPPAPATTGTRPADRLDGDAHDRGRLGRRQGVELAGAARGEHAAGAVRERARDVLRSRSVSTRPSASNGVTGKKRMPSKFMPCDVRSCRRCSASSVRQSRAGRQPSRRRAFALEKAGRVPVSTAAAAAVPGWNRGSSSARGSRARASSAPTKKTSPLGMSASAPSSVSTKSRHPARRRS